jgi:hypothetical protein
MRFDWYQATVSAEAGPVLDALQAGLRPAKVTHSKGRYNYHHTTTMQGDDDDTLAVVFHGGRNGDPNVALTGQATDQGVDVLRGAFPRHRVTRFDAAEDFVQVGAWERLERVLRGVAAEHGVKGRAIVPDDVSEGRTYYLGAPSSDVRVRLYEKTAEQRRKLPEDRWGEIPEGWSRLECQVRPSDRQVREFCAGLNASDIWGFSAWTKAAAAQALQIDVERLHSRIRRERDDDRALRVMVQQYANVLKRLHGDLGDWSCVGLTIGELIAKLDSSN